MARTDPTAPLAVEGAPPDVGPPRRAAGWARSLEITVPAAVLAVIFAACYLWPALLPLPAPTGGDVLESNQPPLTPGHLLGTDPLGNDILSRLLHGGRASLTIGIVVNLLGLVLGGSLGALGAYAGGIADTLVTRILDVFIAFPPLILTIAIAQGLGRTPANTVWALSFFSVPAFARVARAATLRLREQVFMLAARLSGTRGPRVLVRHIAPNILPQLMTFGLLGMGLVIVIEGALSFLGLGVPAPNPSWGNMIQQGQQSISANPGLVLYPSAALFLTVLAFNLLGEALRARWSSR